MAGRGLHYASPARNGNTIIISDRFRKDSGNRQPPTAHPPSSGRKGKERDEEKVVAAGAGGGRVGTSVT